MMNGNNMSRTFHLAVAFGGLFACAGWGSDGTWTNRTTGLWSDSANWMDGQVGGGTGAAISVVPGGEMEDFRESDRWLQIPYEGVSLESLTFLSAIPPTPQGRIRIWGGPITLAPTDGSSSIYSPVAGDCFDVLTDIMGTGDLHLVNTTLAGSCTYTGDTYLDGGESTFYMSSTADGASFAGTNMLPATRLVLGPGVRFSAFSRGSSAAFTMNFTLTEGSRLITAAEPCGKGAGARIAGDGVPEGAFVKTVINDVLLEMSEPATMSGTVALSVEAIPDGQTSLQKFTEIDLPGDFGGWSTLNVRNLGNSLMRCEADALKGRPNLHKTGNGTLALGSTENYTGRLILEEGVVELKADANGEAALKMVAGGAGELRVVDPGTTLKLGEVGPGAVVEAGAANVEVDQVLAGTPTTSLAVRGGRLSLGGVNGLKVKTSTPVAGAWLHVDASDPGSLELCEENGTNFVTRWRDCDGGAHCAKAGMDNGVPIVLPFISTNFLGGLPVVDFGSYRYREQNADVIPGYGAYLDWDARNKYICEVFMVYSDTEDAADLDAEKFAANFLLGDVDNYSFHRGMGTKLFHSLFADPNVRMGLIEVDGEVKSVDDELPPGFHLIHLRTSGPTSAAAFARNRSAGFGGQRIAEALIFDQTLGDDAVGQISDYLMRKWFRTGPLLSMEQLSGTEDVDINIAAGEVLNVKKLEVGGSVEKTGAGTLGVGVVALGEGAEFTVQEGELIGCLRSNVQLEAITLAAGTSLGAAEGTSVSVGQVAGGGGTFVKTGAGSVSVGDLDADFSSVDVRGGTLSLSPYAEPVLPPGSWLHMDASEARTLTTEIGEDGKTYVTCWKSVEDVGDGLKAAARAQEVKPWISTDYLNGKPVIDFGSYYYPNTFDGYGAYLKWDCPDTAIREVFMVYSDTDDVQGLPETFAPNFFLGAADPNYQFHRGCGRTLFHPDYAHPNVRNGLVEVDGVVRTIDYVLPPGFHVIHIQTTANVTADMFANDRGVGRGGQRIAEVVIYNEELDNLQAAAATAYLQKKWLPSGTAGGSETPVREGSRTFADLKVASGATADFSGWAVTATNLTLGGTVRVASLTLAKNGVWVCESTGEGVRPVTVEGKFVIEPNSAVSLRIEGPALPMERAQYELGRITDVDARTLGRLKVGGSAIPAGWSGILRLDGSRLVLSVEPLGLSVILR